MHGGLFDLHSLVAQTVCKIMTFAWWHVLAALAPMLPTFWSIWHIWNHAFATSEKKMFWLVFVIFLPVMGGVVYIFIGRKQALGKRPGFQNN